VELSGGGDDSGSGPSCELRVGCGRRWNLDGHCYIPRNVEGFQRPLEIHVLTVTTVHMCYITSANLLL